MTLLETPAAPPDASALMRHAGAALSGMDQEHRIANLVRHLFERARDARRPLTRQWKKNYRVLNNKVWTARAESWQPAPEVAEIWPVCASLNAWMTDQRPTLEVVPSAVQFSEYHDQWSELGQNMNAALGATFSDNLLDGEISKALWDVFTYRVGYLKTEWQPWLADGLGDTLFTRVDPFTVYPDPFARSMRQLNYIIEAKIMSIDDLDRAFPGAARKIQGGWLEEVDEAPHVLDDTTNPAMPRTNLAPLTGNVGSWDSRRASDRVSRPGITDSPVVTVLECWVRNHRHEKVKPAPDDGIPDGMTRTIESWQCIVVCGNAVLLNEPAENINAFGSHPYDRLVLFDTGEWYGPCLVEFLTSPQESINRMLAAIESNISLVGNPMLVEDPRSLSRNKRITNKPGQRVDANPDQVKWLEPPTLNPVLPQLISYYEAKIEAISGMSAIVRGFQPSGRNAQGVLDSVQDAAFVRVRATLRELERALKGVGMKMTANIAEFYTEPRLISLMGPDGTRVAQQLRANHFYIHGTEEGKRLPMRFNLLADAGSQQATSRQARAAEAERMFALGVIDVLEVLKAKQWPNWYKVSQRVMTQQAEQGTLGQPPNKRQATGRVS